MCPGTALRKAHMSYALASRQQLHVANNEAGIYHLWACFAAACMASQGEANEQKRLMQQNTDRRTDGSIWGSKQHQLQALFHMWCMLVSTWWQRFASWTELIIPAWQAKLP